VPWTAMKNGPDLHSDMEENHTWRNASTIYICIYIHIYIYLKKILDEWVKRIFVRNTTVGYEWFHPISIG
jgi:hypothetical protein